jgi:hypothetical protein
MTVPDGGVLPSDLDGATAPPDGEPGYFLDFDSTSTLALRTFAPNFAATPATATITSLPDIPVAAFSEACGGGTCIPQPGQGRKLDSLGDRLMYRLAYRNFGGGHESMVVNHSIVAQGGNVGPRWYLLDSMTSDKNGVASFALKAQGTYAPDNTGYRWMGSIAMDDQGNMALGYSFSSTSIFPSIAVTGRLASDPIVNTIGTMGNEIILKAGGGAQTGTNRWGDYSSMRIDPTDDCTFWYTNQYYPTTSAANWYTYIGAFRFSTCGNGGGFTLSTLPASLTIAGGGSDSSSQVTINPTNGFNSAVTLGANCVAPITCSFNPNPVPGSNSPTSSAMTVNVAANAPSGTTTETITGNSGGVISTATFLVNVPFAQFTLSASSNPTVRRGSSASVTIKAKDVSGSTNSPVTLSVDKTVPLPTGVSATINAGPISSNGGTATLKITATRTAQVGPFPVTVKGDDGNSATVIVNASVR